MSPDEQPVWTFRGYELRPGDFTTAMIHFFRAEVSRANVWRQRLDTTTNWAVITTAAIITFAFGTEGVSSHSVIILNTLLVTLFLFIEARRYRYYELWSSRIRLMETDFFAAMLVPPFRPSADWAEGVAESLLHPRFPISNWEALGRRLRRNYLWLYLLLGLVWGLKVWVHPVPAVSWAEFVGRAALGRVPGQVMLVVGLVYNAALVALALFTRGLHEATGEVLPRYGVPDAVPGGRAAGERGWFRRSGRRQQFLSFVITKHADEVARLIMQKMSRGVTRLEGTGMYSGEERGVLMCATTVTEIPQLKAVVSGVDPEGFVIITPVQEILGRGFVSLQDQE
jgi:uncharacterized membrane protein